MVPAGPGRYKAMVGSMTITRPTRSPLFDAARALLPIGLCARDRRFAARHAGSSVVAMRSTIGEAARWTIEESDSRGLQRRLWRPRPFEGGSPETADVVEAGQPDPVAAPAVGEGGMTARLPGPLAVGRGRSPRDAAADRRPRSADQLRALGVTIAWCRRLEQSGPSRRERKAVAREQRRQLTEHVDDLCPSAEAVVCRGSCRYMALRVAMAVNREG